jgi:hypothetical protein
MMFSSEKGDQLAVKGPNQCRCSSCHTAFEKNDTQIVLVQKGNPVTGAKDQYRCRCCTNLRVRVSKLTSGSPLLAHPLKHLTPEDRTQWMKDNAQLCGADLQRVVYETVARTNVKRQTVDFTAHGEFVDYDVAETKYQSEPATWEAIQNNATRFTDPVRNKLMIWLPKFSLNMSQREEDEETHKRKVESQTKMKAMKKAKVEKITNENKTPNDGEPATEEEVVTKPISVGHIQRLEKIIPKLEQLQFDFTTAFTSSQSPDMQECVPAKLIKKSTESNTAFTEALTLAREYYTTKAAPKGGVATLFKSIKERSNDLKVDQERLEGCLSLAQLG